jgi:hypothetical protein
MMIMEYDEDQIDDVDNQDCDVDVMKMLTMMVILIKMIENIIK